MRDRDAAVSEIMQAANGEISARQPRDVLHHRLRGHPGSRIRRARLLQRGARESRRTEPDVRREHATRRRRRATAVHGRRLSLRRRPTAVAARRPVCVVTDGVADAQNPARLVTACRDCCRCSRAFRVPVSRRARSSMPSARTSTPSPQARHPRTTSPSSRCAGTVGRDPTPDAPPHEPPVSGR